MLAYASTALNLSSLNSSLPVALLNLSFIADKILIGFPTNHLHPTNVLLVSALGSALAVFLT